MVDGKEMITDFAKILAGSSLLAFFDGLRTETSGTLMSPFFLS